MLIILDVAHDMDRGLRTIQKLKRHRVNAPIIAFTQNISREFGAKIISQGVRYYFSRDFNPRELLEVADSYLKVGLPAASADEE
jgi:DNA-binding response OmpR family regulator